MQIIKANPLNNEDLENLGLSWHTDVDNTPYVSDEIIEVSEEEAQKYYDAANELYDMYVEAGQYVIDNDLFFELGDIIWCKRWVFFVFQHPVQNTDFVNCFGMFI